MIVDQPLKVRTLQATYRVNPKKLFNVEVVTKLLESIVTTEIGDLEYSEKVVPEIAMNIAGQIRNAVKEEQYERYRIVVSVTIGQKRQQSVQMYHSFLWDANRDSFALFNYDNPHLYVNAVVYGVYLD